MQFQKDDPNKESPLSGRVDCFLRMKHWNEAIDDLKTLVNMNPNKKEYHIRLSWALYRLERHNEAINGKITFKNKI